MDCMPLMLEDDMTAWQALKLLRKNGAVSREQVKLIKHLVRTAQAFPPDLLPLLDLVYLVQTRPLTDSLH